MASILYNNILRASTLLAEDTATNHPTSNALDGITSTQVGFETGAIREIEFDHVSPVTVDALAFARHNFFTVGATVQVHGFSGTWALLYAVTPSNNDVYVFEASEQTYTRFKISVSGHTDTAYCADIFLGKRLDLQRGQKYGFIKPEFADSDQVVANMTRGQNITGLTIKSKPKSARFQLFYYTGDWFDTHWLNLIQAMKKAPIYITWDSSEKPFYCWPKRNIPQPKYSKNILNHYDATLDMNGLTA